MEVLEGGSSSGMTPRTKIWTMSTPREKPPHEGNKESQVEQDGEDNDEDNTEKWWTNQATPLKLMKTITKKGRR